MGLVEVFNLCLLLGVSLPPALGIAAWVVALAPAPVAQAPRYAPRGSLLVGALVVAAVAGCAAVSLVLAGRRLVALPIAGVGMTVAAGVVYLVRAGRGRRDGGHDDDADGGGPPRSGDDDAPRTPGADGVDWDAFERDFWAHVDQAPRSSALTSAGP